MLGEMKKENVFLATKSLPQRQEETKGVSPAGKSGSHEFTNCFTQGSQRRKAAKFLPRRHEGTKNH